MKSDSPPKPLSSPRAPKIRVMLIEDNRLLRDGIGAILNEQPDIKAVASLGSADALQSALKLKPHVVLLDLGLKSQSSLRVAETIKRKLPSTYIVIMDLIPTHPDVVEFVKAGVSGFILKDASIDEFLSTVRSVVAGKKVLPSALTDSLFSHIIQYAVKSGKSQSLMRAVRLTRREKEVLDLIARGMSNKEIATALHIAIHTVKSHVHNTLEKLQLHTRLELGAFAHQSEIVEKANSKSAE